MPGDELRMAFVLASQTPSSRAEESGSRPPSVKHRSDEVRGAGAWRHRHLEREWFAHTDGHMLDIMMSRSARRTRRRRGHRGGTVTYSVPSTERLLNAKHFSRLPPKSVARQ